MQTGTVSCILVDFELAGPMLVNEEEREHFQLRETSEPTFVFMKVRRFLYSYLEAIYKFYRTQKYWLFSMDLKFHSLLLLFGVSFRLLLLQLTTRLCAKPWPLPWLMTFIRHMRKVLIAVQTILVIVQLMWIEEKYPLLLELHCMNLVLDLKTRDLSLLWV